MSCRFRISLLVSLFLALQCAPKARANGTVELVPTSGPLSECRLTKTPTELILWAGDLQVERIAYSFGQNVVDPKPGYDDKLLLAVKTLSAMREAGLCR